VLAPQGPTSLSVEFMPDKDGRYSDAERRTYKSPPCELCGSPTRQSDWSPVTVFGDDQAWWFPGLPDCTNLAAHVQEG
jgi:hypothetical protein